MPTEQLAASAITDGLDTQVAGRRVVHHPSVTSTMDVARGEAQAGAEEGTVVVADEQTSGRGRIKRPWLSPKGGVALSVILRPEAALLPALIMLASLAVSRAIRATTGLKPEVKWPNDVLIGGKKVCGILIENGLRGNRVDYAVIGIGLNINVRVSDYPEIQATATSLSTELGREVSRLSVVRALLVEMDRLYLALRQGGSIYEEWRDSLVTLGKEVRVTLDQTVYEGIAESVARDGSLLVRQADGNLVKVVAGDATLRR